MYVSGHPCQEEIKLIYTLVKPKYAIPVHGEYKHLKAQASIAKRLGYDSKHIFILASGDVLELDKNDAKVNGKVPVGAILVDGLGVGDVKGMPFSETDSIWHRTESLSLHLL